MVTAHTVGYYPYVLVIVHQNGIFILGSDVTDISDAVTVYLEVFWGWLIVICCIARQRNSFLDRNYFGINNYNSKLIAK
jgi:hypothetical protein